MKKRQPIDPAMIVEMRRLRGLNKSFDEIAEALNKKGFTNSTGGPLKNNHIVYAFQKTKDQDLNTLEARETPKANMVDAVLQGPLQPDIKITLIEKIQKGEIKDLNYKKLDIPQGGGRIFEKGNYANPASKVSVEIPGDRLKERCKLLVHYWDEIKKIADS